LIFLILGASFLIDRTSGQPFPAGSGFRGSGLTPPSPWRGPRGLPRTPPIPWEPLIKSTIKIWAHFCYAKTGLSAPICPLCGQIPLLSLARFVFVINQRRPKATLIKWTLIIGSLLFFSFSYGKHRHKCRAKNATKVALIADLRSEFSIE
jgi:hypothetical protein